MDLVSQEHKTQALEMREHVKAYESQLYTFLPDYRGKFAVGRIDDQFSFWDTKRDALQFGYIRYGTEKTFLVKQVGEIDVPLRFSRDISSLNIVCLG